VVKPNTLTFVSGLLLATVAGTAVHWHDRAKRLQDVIQYMVEDELDDADEAVRLWSGEE
jgi:hypothetical protein